MFIPFFSKRRADRTAYERYHKMLAEIRRGKFTSFDNWKRAVIEDIRKEALEQAAKAELHPLSPERVALLRAKLALLADLDQRNQEDSSRQ